MLLSELTTMRVGGPAARLVQPGSREELIAEALQIWAEGDDWLALGGGSNVVVSDAGFDGCIIRIVTGGVEVLSRDGDRVVIRVQAGEPWDGLVERTVAEGWAGIEALSGIPGSVGAAPVQNIGAYGQELADSLVAIDFLDYLSGQVERIPAPELGLEYRSSVLKRGRQGVVLAVELELTASVTGTVSYSQLAQALGVPLGASVPLGAVREGVLALRAGKGMVVDPADPDSVSCGSFFTNPIVRAGFARGLPAAAPRWPFGAEAADVAVPLGREPAPPAPAAVPLVKLSAAWLIEHAGIGRGFALAGSRAAISSKHSLAIINRGGATAEQVAELSRFIRARVLAQFGVALQPEPVAVAVQL